MRSYEWFLFGLSTLGNGAIIHIAISQNALEYESYHHLQIVVYVFYTWINLIILSRISNPKIFLALRVLQIENAADIL